MSDAISTVPKMSVAINAERILHLCPKCNLPLDFVGKSKTIEGQMAFEHWCRCGWNGWLASPAGLIIIKGV